MNSISIPCSAAVIHYYLDQTKPICKITDVWRAVFLAPPHVMKQLCIENWWNEVSLFQDEGVFVGSSPDVHCQKNKTKTVESGCLESSHGANQNAEMIKTWKSEVLKSQVRSMIMRSMITDQPSPMLSALIYNAYLKSQPKLHLSLGNRGPLAEGSKNWSCELQAEHASYHGIINMDLLEKS